MTPDRATLYVWGGGALVVVIVGWAWLSFRSGELAAAQAKSDDLNRRYIALFHPDQAAASPPNGVAITDAVKAAQVAAHKQQDDAAAVENALVPDLLPQYRNSDPTSGANMVRMDHLAIIQRAQRQKMKLPATLPLDSGLDSDDTKRAIQLAQLYLYRAVIDQCLESGVTRVDAVTLGKAEADPSASYEIMTCEFELAARFENGQMLLQNLLLAHKLGIGVASLSIEPTHEDLQKIHLVASLIILNRDHLPAGTLTGVPAGSPGQGAPAAMAPSGAAAHPRLGGN
jgi:hypothetical protein